MNFIRTIIIALACTCCQYVFPQHGFNVFMSSSNSELGVNQHTEHSYSSNYEPSNVVGIGGGYEIEQGYGFSLGCSFYNVQARSVFVANDTLFSANWAVSPFEIPFEFTYRRPSGSYRPFFTRFTAGISYRSGFDIEGKQLIGYYDDAKRENDVIVDYHLPYALGAKSGIAIGVDFKTYGMIELGLLATCYLGDLPNMSITPRNDLNTTIPKKDDDFIFENMTGGIRYNVTYRLNINRVAVAIMKSRKENSENM